MSLQAIESGLLPGDILDDIPGKYVDGTIVCEVSNGSLTILLTIGKIGILISGIHPCFC